MPRCDNLMYAPRLTQVKTGSMPYPIAVLGFPTVHQDAAPDAGDLRLQIAKRLDWRFLLPDPNLGDVACVGPVDTALLDALREFSTSLSVVGSLDARSRSEGFDLLVACSVDVSEIREAATLIKPQGNLYWEVDRGRWLKAMARTAFAAILDRGQPVRRRWRDLMAVLDPASCTAALEQIGLTDIEAHWHRPDFAGCLEIIPLNDSSALGHLFRQRQGSAKDWLLSTLGRGLMKLKLLPHLVPCFSLIARRQADRR